MGPDEIIDTLPLLRSPRLVTGIALLLPHVDDVRTSHETYI
jgi:hypothetical protein